MCFARDITKWILACDASGRYNLVDASGRYNLVMLAGGIT